MRLRHLERREYSFSDTGEVLFIFSDQMLDIHRAPLDSTTMHKFVVTEETLFELLLNGQEKKEPESK